MNDKITLLEKRKPNSLIEIWKMFGYPMLSIWAKFHTNAGYIITIPFPKVIMIDDDTHRKIEFILSQYSLDTLMQCDLIVCDRNDFKKILGTAATLSGKLKDLLQYIGYGTYCLREDMTIQNCLGVLSNDYSVFELVSELLGLKDMSEDEAPFLMQYPSLSIIIPGRGIHNTINNVIYSIQKAMENLKTDNIKWECLIVDDNNKIPLSCIIDFKLKEHVKVIRSEQRLYSSRARNLGIKYAKGDLFLFLDGDTMIESSYIKEHLYRHMVGENLITVSLREYLNINSKDVLSRKADISKDTRMFATYSSDRIGLIPVYKTINVRALEQTNNFRNFGFGKKIGPIDLPFMVKGNNLMVSRNTAHIMFPPQYIGYGPEDIMFAAKAIARGCMVIPVLSSGVYHINHPPRSGSSEKRDIELQNNLKRMKKDLMLLAWDEWSNEK